MIEAWAKILKPALPLTKCAGGFAPGSARRTLILSLPPLKPLHAEEFLSQPKLAGFRKLTTEVLIASLRPGEPGALKARPDGTMMEGHHRVYVLRERGVEVDELPREVVEIGSA